MHIRNVILLATLALAAAIAQPIRLDPKNPHYFQFRGKTVALVTSAEHYGSVINGAFDNRKYLATLATDGLNFTRIFGGSYFEVPGKSFGIQRNTLAPEPGKLIAPWPQNAEGKFGLNQWNAPYFKRYTDFLEEASRLGIVVEITLFSSHYQEMHWKASPFNPSNNVNLTDAIDWKKLHTLENGNILAHQERFVRKLVQEANRFDNVYFEIQNEPWSDRPRPVDVVNSYLPKPARDRFPNVIEVADELSSAWQKKVAGWITSEEASLPNRHLISQNCCNFGAPVGEIAPQVSIVGFHYASPAAATWNYGLGKVLAADETGFSGRDDDTYRRQAWNFMLSGGGVFNNLDYSFTVGHEDGTDLEPNGPGGGSPTLRRQLRILHEFLNSLPLADVEPDARTVRQAGGTYARVLSARSGEFGIYLDGSGTARVTLDLPKGQCSSRWINVKTGAIDKRDDFRHSGGTRDLDSPAFEGGVALRLSCKLR